MELGSEVPWVAALLDSAGTIVVWSLHSSPAGRGFRSDSDDHLAYTKKKVQSEGWKAAAFVNEMLYQIKIASAVCRQLLLFYYRVVSLCNLAQRSG